MGKLRYTTETFIEKARECHGDNFDYSLVDYQGINTKVKIICPVEGHGVFEQTPTNHTHKTAPRGCPKCRYIKSAQGIMKSREEADLDLYTKFGDRIKIKSGFVKHTHPCTLTCSKHGDFVKTVTSTLGLKYGCTKCAEEDMGKSLTSPKSQEDFILDAVSSHGYKYDYSNVEYVNSVTKIEIYCPTHDHTFFMQPDNHLNGERCIYCAREVMAEKLTGWYTKENVERNKEKLINEKNNLYVMHMTDGEESFYKIGIAKDTNHRVGHIRRQSNYEPKVLLKARSSTYNCFNKEQKLHSMFKKDRYKPSRKFKGHTECFSLDREDLIFLEEVLLSI